MANIKGLIRYLKNSTFLKTVRTVKLNALKQRYALGNKIALIDTLKMCTDIDRTEMPDWVAGAVFQALNKWRECEVLTLDEAFGVTRQKSFRLDVEHKKRVTAFQIYNEYETSDQEAKNLRKQGRRDASVWEILGGNHSMSGGTAKDYYYIAKHEIDPKDTEGDSFF